MSTILAKAIGKIAYIQSGCIFELKQLCEVNDWNNVNKIQLGKLFKKVIENYPELDVIIIGLNPTGAQMYKKV